MRDIRPGTAGVGPGIFRHVGHVPEPHDHRSLLGKVGHSIAHGFDAAGNFVFDYDPRRKGTGRVQMPEPPTRTVRIPPSRKR